MPTPLGTFSEMERSGCVLIEDRSILRRVTDA
jgi:hypothetical protein